MPASRPLRRARRRTQTRARQRRKGADSSCCGEQAPDAPAGGVVAVPISLELIERDLPVRTGVQLLHGTGQLLVIDLATHHLYQRPDLLVIEEAARVLLLAMRCESPAAAHLASAEKRSQKDTDTHTHTHTQIEASHRRLPHRSRRRQPSALRSSSPPLSHTLRGSVLTTKSAVPAKCAQFRERFAAHLFRGVRAACGGPRGSSGCRGGGELRCCQGFWQGTSSQLTRWRKFAWQAILVCTLFGL